VFSGGGEKPPVDLNAQDQDDEEDMMVPGFASSGVGGGWWGLDDDGPVASSSASAAPLPGRTNTALGAYMDPYFAAGTGSSARRGEDNAVGGGADDFIPGFGVASESGPNYNGTFVAPRKNGPLPPQEDVYGGPGPANSERGGDRGGGRSRWGGGGRRRY